MPPYHALLTQRMNVDTSSPLGSCTATEVYVCQHVQFQWVRVLRLQA